MDNRIESSKLYQAYLIINARCILFHSKVSASVFTGEEMAQLAKIWDAYKIGYRIEETHQA